MALLSGPILGVTLAAGIRWTGSLLLATGFALAAAIPAWLLDGVKLANETTGSPSGPDGRAQGEDGVLVSGGVAASEGKECRQE